jgi:cytochrome c
MRACFALLALAVVGGCGNRTTSAPSPSATSTVSTTAASAPESKPDSKQDPAAAAQLARGERLYAEKCTSCHGARGEGGPQGPALVGAGALPLDPRPGSHRLKQFVSAANVTRYIKMRMPPKEEGSLAEDDALALAVYTVHANGVDLPKTPVTLANASEVPTHRALDANAKSPQSKP